MALTPSTERTVIDMNVKKIGIALVVASLAASLAACSTPAAVPAEKPVVQLHASWANAYPTFAAMVKNSDAIVRGTVGAASPTILQDKVPYTDFTFHVTTWIKTKDEQPSDISIHQTGGTTDSAIEIVDDDPLLVVGTAYVLFLNEYAPGKYFIVGGPTGRLNASSAGKLTAFKGSIIATAEVPADVSSLTTRVAGIQTGTMD
jgi:hypothetical protein